jgi:hypothetical protein
MEQASRHRMAEEVVRRRTALMLAAIGGLVYISVSLLGRPGGAFTEVELPDVAGLPIPVPQIERRLPPLAPAMPGTSLPNSQPGATP